MKNSELPSAPIKAYSYLRFSTPEQMQGDSSRRQRALAERYATEHGLELDTELRFDDEGVSAFRGRNLGPDGQLGLFVVALKEGLVPQGSFLLVESLDRISRQTPRVALRALESVVEAGAVVVTLADGRKYDKTNLDDTTSLLTSVIIFMRAHEESATKASRLRAAWSEKRARAIERSVPMTRSCPAWLRLDVSTGSYREIPERVQVVRRIFDMTLAGAGQHSIAQTLNREGIIPFGRGLHWHRSYIAKLLESPAVQGVFVPHIQSHEKGKRVREALSPIADYFPRIISEEIVESVAELRRAAGQPRRGRHATAPLTNIFGGLGRCSCCGASMTLTNKGKGCLYYVCSRAKAGAGCIYRTLRFKDVEERFLAEWPRILAEMPRAASDAPRLQHSLATMNEHLQWIESSTENIIQAIQSSGTRSATAPLMQRLGELEKERVKTLHTQAELLMQLKSLQKTTLTMRVETLQNALSAAVLDKAKVNALLRLLLTAVHLSREDGTFTFEWRHSSVLTAVRYTGDPSRCIAFPRINTPPPKALYVPPFAELVMLQMRKNLAADGA